MMAIADNRRRDDYQTIDFEETELRLGLPGGPAGGVGNEAADENGVKNIGKRGFSETESSITANHIDLKLNLSTTILLESNVEKAEQKLVAADHRQQLPPANNNNDPAKPPAPKAQVVGWPPVRSYRKNIMSTTTAAQKTTTTPATTSDEKKTTENNAAGGAAAAFVKVSLDGAPYLRKVDLKLYKSYNQLAEALGKMFSTFSTTDNCGSHGTKDFMNESKLIDLLNGTEYVPTYEDKDGDWMLVGDIPWGVFVDSCKRLRIMKGSEAIGLAPRAVEKCNS